MIVKTLDYDKTMGYSIGMFVYIGDVAILTPIILYADMGQRPFGSVVGLPDKEGYLSILVNM